jgi:hypothetical protein
MSSYQTALTISTVIKNIDAKTYLLPSINMFHTGRNLSSAKFYLNIFDENSMKK